MLQRYPVTLRTEATRPLISFDPQRRAGSPGLHAAAATLAADLELLESELGLRQRSRRREDREKFRLAIECILCNLVAVRSLTGKEHAPLGVPRSSKTMWQGGRYQSPVYGQHFLHALDLLSRLTPSGLIADGPRGYGFPNGASQRSSIIATAAFNGRFPAQHFSLSDIVRADEPEVIILKSAKGPDGRSEPIDYRDTALTKRRRKQVHTLNERLRAAQLHMPSADLMLLMGSDDGQPVDPSRRTVRRIFNNGDWMHGGRLFGGFWENMKRADRFEYLRIGTAANPGGESVANIDFGQLFPNLAYLRVDREPPDGDLYDITGDGSHREGWKKLLNALLFATKPMRQWPRDTRGLFPPGMKLQAAIALIQEVHAPIADLLDGSGVGFRLMLLESEILLTALGLLADAGITALPLHDSVLVAKSEADCAKAIMAEAFKAVTGSGRARLGVQFE